MYYKNRKISDLHRLLLNLTNKTDLRRKDKYIALSNLSIYYTWKNIRKSYTKNKFKISNPTWNDEFKLSDGSYSISDIQDYFDPSIRICTNKIENRIKFKIKTGYYLELLIPGRMKSLGSTKNKFKKKKVENVPLVPNKSFGQLLDVVFENFIFVKTFELKFLYIKVWFKDQNSNPLKIEDKINITLVIN